MNHWLLSLAVFSGAFGRIVWLAGLVLALRGTRPEQRARILRAYAACRRRPPRA